MALELVNKLPYDHPYRWDGTLFGGPKLWRPDELGASLALWLDAEDASTITLNGSTVSQWDDKSGNNRHVSQATAANQPSYSASGFVSKAGISFNGTSQYLFNTSPFMFDAGSISIFTAARPAPTATTQFFLSEGSAVSSTPIYSPLVNRGAIDFKDQGFFYRTDLSVTVSGSTLLFDDGFAEADSILGFTDTGSVITGHKNGTVGIPVSYIRTGTTTLDRMAVGGLLRSTFSLGMPFDAGEIVATTGVLSTADRQKLEGYLAWKWGLEANLPADHPYKNAPPTV